MGRDFDEKGEEGDGGVLNIVYLVKALFDESDYFGEHGGVVNKMGDEKLG